MWPFPKRRCLGPPRLDAPPEWMVEEVRRRTGRRPEECRRLLTDPTLEEYWALTGDGPNEFGEARDPVETDSSFALVLLRATLEAEREIGPGGYDGYCFMFWDRKRRILRRKYGVKWRDPSDMNPQSCYD